MKCAFLCLALAAPSVVQAQTPEQTPPPQATPQQTPPQQTKVSLRFTGGWGYFAVGDYRTAWAGTVAQAREFAAQQRYSLDDGPPFQQSGSDLSAELVVQLSPKLAAVIGGGRVSSTSNVGYTLLFSNGSTAGSQSQKTEIVSNIAAFSLEYKVWSSKSGRSDARINFGPDLYLPKASRVSEPSFQGETIERGGALGLHLNASFRRELAPRFSIVAMAGYRRAKLSGFESSTATSTSSNPRPFQAWQRRSTSSGSWYDAVGLGPVTPSTFLRNVREGNVDFSGPSARVGIQIDF